MARAGTLRIWPLLMGLLCGMPIAQAETFAEAPSGGVLRVCSDPANMPHSNARGEGFEDRIAALLAADLHLHVQIVWGMQRLGFLRRTLQAHLCDVVMGLSPGIAGTLTTRPYYRSRYVFVSLHARDLRITSFDDPRVRHLHIGLHAIGAGGTNPPPAMSMAVRGLGANVVGFTMYADREIRDPAGRIIDAVARGDIDAAAVWGPFAGWFGKPYGDRLDISPLQDDPAVSGLPYAYDIAVAVRKQDTALRDALDGALARQHQQILAILRDYGIPLDGAGSLLPPRKKEI